MMDAGRHPRIELLVDSEVEDITGFVGNYRALVRRRARFVDSDECTSCGECEKVCPVIVPDEYQEGLSSRKAIYLPFPQAVPSAFSLDVESCLGFNPIACGKCLEVCDKKCIDFDAKDEFLDLEVGTVVVATGMEVYDPRENDEYGYTRFPNVVTSMEFERLINAGGPTDGELVRPSDRAVPLRVGFIQCVGSRSVQRGVPYCSNICCMNTIKETLLLADHYPESRSTVYYMDIRAFGKGFEDLYRRSREAGVRYIRGLPGTVKEAPGSSDLIVEVENTLTGTMEEHRLDMLVLAVGMVPRRANGNGKRSIDEILSLSHTSDGFVMEAHPKLKPVDAPTRGVYFAGCVESPKDVKDSVTQAGAAAARAGNLLGAGQVRIEAITATLDADRCQLCTICARVCPFHAIEQADKKKGLLPQFVEAACAGCGTCAAECPFDAIDMRHFADQQVLAQIDGILAEDPMQKIVGFACNWCSYAGGDNAGTSRLQYPASVRLIRTMCSGRVDQAFIWHAFRKGAPLVLVSGCHFTDCHYIDAVTWTQRRIEKIWSKMEKLGIRPERLQLEWISAAEGQKFARVMQELDSMLRQVTAKEVEESMQILAKESMGGSPPILPKKGREQVLPIQN
ncbi:MAG: hydrogenase iron-sulfur subunit [Thermoanaerobaculia bacterium]